MKEDSKRPRQRFFLLCGPQNGPHFRYKTKNTSVFSILRLKNNKSKD